jgi:hypothetical protein
MGRGASEQFLPAQTDLPWPLPTRLSHLVGAESAGRKDDRNALGDPGKPAGAQLKWLVSQHKTK